MGLDAGSSHRETWIDLLWATRVEATLGRDVPEIVYHYPACQAALANITEDEFRDTVAERFELFYQGVELANGYHELTDAAELRPRLEEVNEHRKGDGRSELPLPESLLVAMDKGLPPCAGCALGFDRLLMLARGANSIDEAMAFPDG